MIDDSIQRLADELFERDKGTVLPIDLSVCYEYGMRGLCGKGCPDFGNKDECFDGLTEG